MLCDKCKKNVATTHIKTSINGVIESHHLCSQCAKQSSYVQSPLGLNHLLGSFFGDAVKAAPQSNKRKRCSGCGLCFDDIAESGIVGCDKCYDTFFEQLLPSLQRMHGKAYHAGKVPERVRIEAPVADTAEDKIAELKAQLSDAISKEDFEQAAKLRDEIKALKEEV